MESEMTAEELRDILMSAEYKQELTEISSYLASIKQERPMAFCLAKLMWKCGYKFQLEAKRKDLVVNGKCIEFKFHYDFDMERLDNELRRRGDRPYKEMWDAARAAKSSMGWSMLKIYEDMCVKRPDIFVWTICSRDLSKVAADDRKRICVSKEQCEWNERQHPYSDRDYLKVADGFLEKLKSQADSRQFSVLKEEIATNGNFPSTYHFRICDFAA
jgi:hypothetical protein